MRAPQQALSAPRRLLIRRGFEILDIGWECDAGTVDVVAHDDNTLVFAEVKTRAAANKGFPDEAVTRAKRDRNERIAMAFIADFDEVDLTVGFDIVSIMVIAPDRALVQHHISAFSASGGCGAGGEPGRVLSLFHLGGGAASAPAFFWKAARRRARPQMSSRTIGKVLHHAGCRIRPICSAAVRPQAQAPRAHRRADARRTQ